MRRNQVTAVLSEMSPDRQTLAATKVTASVLSSQLRGISPFAYCGVTTTRPTALLPSGVLVTAILTLAPGFSTELSLGTQPTTFTLAGTSIPFSPVQPVAAPLASKVAWPVQLAEPAAPEPWKLSLINGTPPALPTCFTVASVMTSLTVALV